MGALSDSPGVRFTYEAHVEVPTELMALMSAVNPTEKSADGHYDFVMEQPIPSYLLALAVGDVEFRSVGAHTGVYATSDLIDAAEYEFAEMEDMLVAAEGLYGKYAWERYDLLVPLLPLWRQENPHVCHPPSSQEIAASFPLWPTACAQRSGNLVTNATWDDFWLNEASPCTSSSALWRPSAAATSVKCSAP